MQANEKTWRGQCNSLLHTRIARQLKPPIFRGVNRLVRPADHVLGWTAGSTRSIAHHPHVALDDRFFEALVLRLADVNRQLVSLNLEARIGDHDMSGENTDRFRRIENGLVGINLSDDRFLGGRRIRRVLRFWGRTLFS